MDDNLIPWSAVKDDTFHFTVVDGAALTTLTPATLVPKRHFAFQTFTKTLASTPSILGFGITHQPRLPHQSVGGDINTKESFKFCDVVAIFNNCAECDPISIADIFSLA